VFCRKGWQFSRQTGSHVILKKPGQRLVLSVPQHDTLDRGTLRHPIRAAGMTVEEFVELLGDL